MKQTIKFSIIIPCYNAEKTLPRCLTSVCNSILKEIEIICINDASSDTTLQVLTEFKRNDSRIKIINFDKNQGAAKARNAALKIAKGEIIGFVDSDDDVDECHFNDIYIKMKETNSDINIISFKQINPDSIIYNHELAKFISRFGSDIHRFDTAEKLIFLVDYCWRCSIRRSFWKKYQVYFPEHIKGSEDQCFWKPQELLAKRISLLDTYSYNYYWNPLGLSKADKALCETIRGHDEMVARLPLKFHLRIMEKCFWWMNVSKMRDKKLQNRLKIEYKKKLYLKAQELGIKNYEFPSSYSYTFLKYIKVSKKNCIKKYTILNIPIVKIVYSPNYYTTYILGIAVNTKIYNINGG